MYEKKKSAGDDDTIVAVITPPGEGGIAALRLAGKSSLSILKKVFVGSARSTGFKPFQLRFGAFVTSVGQTLDEVTAVYMPKGKSYTGLQQVEIFCHGGGRIVHLILQELISAGARAAEPGEFTKLAFLNGRIDLARAEGVAEIIAASTEASYKAGREHLLGAYTEHVNAIRNKLVDILADIEAGVDFSEEEIDPLQKEQLDDLLAKVMEEVRTLINSHQGGRIIKEGYRIAIGGRPNVGKSSLFNRLLRQERALVHEEAGTTRDYLSEWIDLGGYAVNLIDTAGLRRGGGPIEEKGRERARDIMESVHLILWMVDLTAGGWPNLLSVDKQRIPKRPRILVGNKLDIAPGNWRDLSAGLPIFPTSCLTGKGIAKLKRELLSCLQRNIPDLTSGQVVTSARHKQKLSKAMTGVKSARKKLKSGESSELIALDLRQALSDMDEITGRVYTEDILERVFSKFCIGK